MNATFQSSAQVLSIGIFFTLDDHWSLLDPVGDAHARIDQSRRAQRGRAQDWRTASGVGACSPRFSVTTPSRHWSVPRCSRTSSATNRATLTGHGFFPHLISAPFHSGIATAFIFSAVASLVAAAASWSRGVALREWHARSRTA